MTCETHHRAMDKEGPDGSPCCPDCLQAEIEQQGSRDSVLHILNGYRTGAIPRPYRPGFPDRDIF